MKKLIYILMILGLTSCKLFSQPPDTLEYYSKDWGDSMKVVNESLRDSIIMYDSVRSENEKLTDSLTQLNYIHNLVIDRLDSLTLLTDTAYWSNFNSLMQVDFRQENDMVEMIINKSDSTWIRFIYVNDYAGYTVKRKYEDAKHIGDGSSNW
jgi:hypothetical protein